MKTKKIGSAENHTPKSHSQDNKFNSQMKKVFEVFYEKPMTMLMAEAETGIMRSNITWYVDEWRDLNKIFYVKTDKCPISQYPRVGYYSTNPKFAPIDNQLTLL